MEGHGTTQQHSIYSNSLVHAATLRSMNEPEKQQKKKKKKSFKRPEREKSTQLEHKGVRRQCFVPNE